MEETYTFSRALHLVRYGGKKMRSIFWKSTHYIEVSPIFGLVRNCGEYMEDGKLISKEIMGSWVEVKE